jgi:nucleotide-binding universal stress UspA family protein
LFSDQVQHETEAYAKQFLARYVHNAPQARLELRVGRPADEILQAVDVEHPDLLALGWPHTGGPARGAIARDLLDRSQVPMLLVAVT